ncbi:alpha-amylase family glycosyl hydrolase [Ornithinicoccus halotolerans]|uniref:alpha-amylase family glycosyl hydrolase n=1 Tax=Ornithinicoccus halotolerans TaxID=1748220 RepID=UPI001E530298|nr:alpha-amylase family glycosyl hydrolase [Ornithinicoccus halotolerans]
MPGSPSLHPGMGAVPHDGGVTFRVWAPNARQVAVTGDFFGWDPAARARLSRDNARSGTWSTFVPGAGPGSHYRFLIRSGGPYRSRIDPVARQVTHSAGDAVVFDARTLDWSEDQFVMPGWDDLVLYEVHIPTFAADGGRPGTFDLAIDRLDHLAWLGVNAVEVMPPFAFAGPVSWGYNPSHLFAIEPSYGGPHAFARFVRAAHARGIAVILDVVYNHLGPGDLHLWRIDGGRRRHYGGSYFYNDRRALTPWGATRPNYDRKQVRNYLRDSAVMWLEDFRVDGLRFDATQYIRSRWGDVHHPRGRIAAGHRFLAATTGDIRSRQPWKLLIAEDMQGDPTVTRPSGEGGLGFHSQWDAGFVHPVRAALETPDDEHRDLSAVARAVTGHGLSAPHERVIYTESHDEVANGRSRLPESVFPGAADSWHARTRAALGLVLTLTSPGIPMLFQGQDVLEDRWFDDQTPVDWDKAHRHAGFLHLTRQLVALRRNLSGATRGLAGRHTRVIRVDDDRKILAYHRSSGGGPRDDTVVVLNLRTTPVWDYPLGMPRPGRWRVRCNTDAPLFGPGLGAVHVTDLDTEPHGYDGYGQHARVTIGPYAALVYSQDA